jgi:hypothetical protein
MDFKKLEGKIIEASKYKIFGSAVLRNKTKNAVLILVLALSNQGLMPKNM